MPSRCQTAPRVGPSQAQPKTLSSLFRLKVKSHRSNLLQNFDSPANPYGSSDCAPFTESDTLTRLTSG